MKTIEEKAREYALNAIHIIELSPIIRQFRAYTAGATKQKAIDIEKACEWLKENARNYAYATDRCYTVADVCDIHKELVEDFRKAMEEQI